MRTHFAILGGRIFMLHVVGAGLAGLAASVAATRAGCPVTLHESTDHAGGRCRSYYDQALGLVIDNGTHLVMDVNQTALSFARAVGGLPFMEQGEPTFPFIDIATGQSWTLSPWALIRRPFDLLRAVGTLGLSSSTTVHESLGNTKSYASIWDPLCVAALNTKSEEASAALFAKLLRMALKQGLSSLNPWIFPSGLSAAFIDPAMETLRNNEVELRFNHRLKSVEPTALIFDDERIALEPNDRVILALPPWAAKDIFPDLPILPTRSIVNGHFLLNTPPTLPGGMPWLGLTGGVGQWVSVRDKLVSVTISAAEAVVGEDAQTIATSLWQELAPHLGEDAKTLPLYRIIKEKRATLAHTPDQVCNRPNSSTPYPNMVLAGDWLKSSWPCTIEAALISGLSAARLSLGDSSLLF
jgi:hypothetical protein